MSTALLVGVCATLLGLVVGSFLNVVVYRVPRRESVMAPGSRCPGCGTPIAPRDNLPVVSWLLLRGRCRTCSRPISSRYPLLEAATAALYGTAAVGLGPGWELPAHLALLSVVVVAIGIALDGKPVPGVVVAAGLAAAVAALVATAAERGTCVAVARLAVLAVMGAGAVAVARRVARAP